ncbi:Os07g0520200 [Oryza sativa Japonica Group]|uniref:Os07g0520200 protein n=2 Tax=Oryza sativa subsp. japonica TaxID=39947 RepID=A0A0P0X6T2_ORYSJ|nr:unknown protein [Oryza sativa Japonica Group]BAF21714.1 Os07g0520200 [Oryza sativa Japonica Group]BAT01800.1 Os07g0520200 [Oryza sativa Japonica Group]|eukprot:NP_001059800.1 Os07g0520200 [Oryza sativa Japonica Group]
MCELLALDHGGEDGRVVGEVADHEGQEDGGGVVAGGEADDGVVDDLLLGEQRPAAAAVAVSEADEVADEVVRWRRLALLQVGLLLPHRRREQPASPRARPEAPAERGERQVERHRPQALQHVGERGGEPLPDGAAREPEQQGGDDVERQQLHQRQHRDGAAPGPPPGEVAPDLAVDPAHVPPQHLRPQELRQRAAHAAVVVADELQHVPPPDDRREAPRLLGRQRLAEEHRLVRRRAGEEHRRRAEQRQLRHGPVPVDPALQPPLGGVATHGTQQGQALADQRQAEGSRRQVAPRRRLRPRRSSGQVDGQRREEGDEERDDDDGECHCSDG